MLHKNIIKLAALLWCVLTVASCTNEDFDKGNNGPDVPEGLPVTLKLNIGTPEVPVVETKSLDNGATFGAINDLAVLVYDEKGENPIVTFHDVEGENQTSVNNMTFDAKTGKRRVLTAEESAALDAQAAPRTTMSRSRMAAPSLASPPATFAESAAAGVSKSGITAYIAPMESLSSMTIERNADGTFTIREDGVPMGQHQHRAREVASE